MKVEMTTTMANPENTARPGDIIDLPKDVAEVLIASGQAIRHEEENKNTEDEQTEEETGTEEEENSDEELRAQIADELVQNGGWFEHELLEEKVQGQENAIDAVIEAMTEEG